jgi:hypothetical protein
MAFKTYRNRAEMERDGWIFDGDGQPKDCRECGQEIEWAKSPRDKNVSIDYGTTVVHFPHCGKSALRRGSEVEPPNRGRDLRRANQPAAESAPADHDLKESLDDLASAVRANTAVLQAALQARKATAPAPTTRVVVHKTEPDSGCPYDEYHDEPYTEPRGNGRKAD